MKPKETFDDWFFRTKGHGWDNAPVYEFANGLVEYTEEAVARLDAAVEEAKRTAQDVGK